MRTGEELAELQSMGLGDKIFTSIGKIQEWYAYWDGKCCVSFSGGKDSTVLADLCAMVCEQEGYDLNLVFVNTGLEYPEVQAHVKNFAEYLKRKYKITVNLAIPRPSMRFDEVLIKYGYPLIGKETAEAIYFARKIGGGQKQREAENDCKKKKGNRGGVLVQSQTVRTARAENIQHLYDATGTWQGNRRTILMGRMPGSGVTQEGGIFEGGFGDRSMFNKEKWLPLARDLPILVSHKCCSVMKKAPIRKYQRENKLKPFIGMLAEESRSRRQSWIRTGCNAFDSKEPSSNPLSFWREQDILQYIKNMSLPIASVYGDVVYTDGEFEYNATPIGGSFKLKCTGCDRTGCIFCAFGAHLEKGETRFERLKITHPKQYDYCMRGGEWSDNPYYDPEAPEYDGEWKNWNPQKIWTPGNGGLGMAKVFDMANELYPNTWRY